MIDFLRKTWVFTRPYRGRLFLGFFCGMMFGVINGIVIAAFKPVLNLVIYRPPKDLLGILVQNKYHAPMSKTNQPITRTKRRSRSLKGIRRDYA